MNNIAFSLFQIIDRDFYYDGFRDLNNRDIDAIRDMVVDMARINREELGITNNMFNFIVNSVVQMIISKIQNRMVLNRLERPERKDNNDDRDPDLFRQNRRDGNDEKQNDAPMALRPFN
jgi:hypothetical protein